MDVAVLVCTPQGTCGQTANGLRNVGACGHAVAIARKMVFVRGQVVENQRSVQLTARRDYTPPFLSLRTFVSRIRFVVLPVVCCVACGFTLCGV
jgi:hypothetical protein